MNKSIGNGEIFNPSCFLPVLPCPLLQNFSPASSLAQSPLKNPNFFYLKRQNRVGLRRWRLGVAHGRLGAGMTEKHFEI